MLKMPVESCVNDATSDTVQARALARSDATLELRETFGETNFFCFYIIKILGYDYGKIDNIQGQISKQSRNE